MKKIKCVEEVIFSKEIERPIFASDQPIKPFTQVEVVVRENPVNNDPHHVRITWDYYDVHAMGSSQFTIPFSEFRKAAEKLKKFQEHINNRGIEQEIHGIRAYTRAKPHLMWSSDLNNMLFTDRDLDAHLELFKEVLQVVENKKRN